MTNSLQSTDFNEAFRERFRFSQPLAETVVRIDRYNLPCIGNNVSDWSNVSQNTIFLRQNGDITIVNPDKSSEIAFLNVMNHRYLQWRRGKLENTPQTRLLLAAYPRDPQALSDGNRDFADRLAETVPDALFVQYSTDNNLHRRGTNKQHDNFVRSQLDDTKLITEWGLEVQLLRGANGSVIALQQLLKAEILSPNPEIRQAVGKLLVPIIGDPKQALEPARNDTPLLRQTANGDSLFLK